MEETPSKKDREQYLQDVARSKKKSERRGLLEREKITREGKHETRRDPDDAPNQKIRR